MSFYPSEKSKGLDSLNDANITTPVNGDTLVFNGEKWENSHDELSAIENVYGSKNLLNNEMVGGTSNTIVFTVNADKSFSTSAGTPSGNVNDKYIANGVLFKAGTYTFSGFPDNTGTDATKVFIEIKTSWSAATRISELNANQLEDTFTLTQDTVLYIRPYFVSEATLPAMTFYPMITDARIKDRTYIPYAPTNRDCMSYAVNTKLGAHNLSPFNPYVGTINGITLTNVGNGTVRLNATSTTGIAWFNIVAPTSNPSAASDYVTTLKKGSYKLVVNSNQALSSNVQVGFFSPTAVQIIPSLTSGTHNEVTFTLSADTPIFLGVRVAGGGISVTNFDIQAFIILADDTDPTYAPYAMTNRELTEKKQYNVTTSITSSNATVQVAFIAIRKGTMVNLYGYVQANTSITAGSNITGTFSGMPKPLWPCTSATFSATMTFCANLGIDGAFTVRVPANISSGQSIFLNFTYATEDLI